MDHSSGLQNVLNTAVEIYPSPNFVQLALPAELDHDPGTQFVYNNEAVNLIAGIVEKAPGQKLDSFMAQEVFSPLGITDYNWTKDAAGNPHTMSGLALYPEDLAKLGHLLTANRVWQDKSIIKPEWFD